MGVVKNSKLMKYPKSMEDGLSSLCARFNAQLYRECIAFYSWQVGVLIPCKIPFCDEEEKLNIAECTKNFKETYGDITIDDLLCNYKQLGITQIMDIHALCYASAIAYKYLTKDVCKEESIVSFLQSLKTLGKDMLLMAPMMFIAGVNEKSYVVVEKLVYYDYNDPLEFFFAVHVHQTSEQFLAFCGLKSEVLLKHFNSNSKMSIKKNSKIYTWFIKRVAEIDASALSSNGIGKLFKLLQAFVNCTLTKSKMTQLEKFGISNEDAAFLYSKLYNTTINGIHVTEQAREKAQKMILSILYKSKEYHSTIEDLLSRENKGNYLNNYYALWYYFMNLPYADTCDYPWLFHFVTEHTNYNAFSLCNVLKFMYNSSTEKEFELLNETEKKECVVYSLMSADAAQKKVVIEHVFRSLGKDYFSKLVKENELVPELLDLLVRNAAIEINKQTVGSINPKTFCNWVSEMPSAVSIHALSLLFSQFPVKYIKLNYKELFWNYRYLASSQCVPNTNINLLVDGAAESDIYNVLEYLVEYKIRYDWESLGALLTYITSTQRIVSIFDKEELSKLNEIALTCISEEA